MASWHGLYLSQPIAHSSSNNRIENNRGFENQMKTLKKYALLLIALLTSATILAITTLKVFADDPAPVLKIQQVAQTQFSITITNGTNVNYEIYWTPVLGDEGNYPWQLLDSADLGVTNWVFDVGTWPVGFFRGSIGNDWDSDSVLNWMDANPRDNSIGALTIIIDSPLNGTVFQ
jgi:hypothetical protein